MGRLTLAIAFIAFAALGTIPTAEAGSSAATTGPPTFPVEEVGAFAAQVEQTLATNRAHVALVARVGVDPQDLPDGVRYTHVGFWVYSDLTKPDGTRQRGYRAHNLYQRADDMDVSDLVQDSPVQFFSGVARLEAAIIVPDARLQEKLARILTGPTYAKLHNPAYSVLSNPATDQFQNCTEHMLNVLMAALYDTDDMARIKSNIRAHVRPQTIALDPFLRLFGPAFTDGVSMADHGERIETTTFASLRDFMARYDLSQRVMRVTGAGAGAL